MSEREKEECKTVHEGETFLHRFRGYQKQEDAMQKQSATRLRNSRLLTSGQTFPVPFTAAVEHIPPARPVFRLPIGSAFSGPPNLSGNGSTTQIPSPQSVQVRSLSRPRSAEPRDFSSFQGLSHERTQ
jgi:hypothetical protein